MRTKAALLQSKRLYPIEQKTIAEDTRREYETGFGRLYYGDDVWEREAAPRRFRFTPKSRYRTLSIWDDQTRNIDAWQGEYEVPVYFLLYNPWKVPWSVSVPLQANEGGADACDVGCRIVPARDVFSVAAGKKASYTPTYEDITKLAAPFGSVEHLAGWRLEHFVVALLLGCHQGVIVTGREEDLLRPMFYRRVAPIAAALSVTIDAPENADLGF